MFGLDSKLTDVRCAAPLEVAALSGTAQVAHQVLDAPQLKVHILKVPVGVCQELLVSLVCVFSRDLC
jgi:hypothetical protein